MAMYDTEIEKAILYYIIFENYECDIQESDFVDAKTLCIAKTIIKLKQDKKEITMLSVTNHIKKGNNSNVIDYITNLGTNVYGTNADDVYNELIELSQKRQCYNLLMQNLAEIKDCEATTKIFELINNLNLIASRQNIEPDFNEKIINAVADLEEKYNKRNDYSYYTGIFQLDDLMCGLHPKELTIIGARPGIGKTTLALQIAEKVASRGKDVLFISLEMSDEQIIQKMIARKGNIQGFKMRRGTLEDKDWESIVQASNSISKIPFNTCSTIRTIQQLESYAKRLKNKDKLDMLVIDYIQLLKSSSKFNSREQEVADISRRLKLLTLELNIPIIALCQLNRNAVRNEPTTADLRESGSLEQDADNIIFLYKEDEDSKDVDLKLAKQRAGQTGKLKLIFKKDTSTFENGV